MSYGLGFMIESAVAVLLAITIIYCVMLNDRLKRLKGDEAAMKGMVAELVTAIGAAERAIAGLKITVGECEAKVGGQLESAERLNLDIERQSRAAEAILQKFTRIVAAARSVPELASAAPSVASSTPTDAQSMAAAAQAIAERARQRVTGWAA